MVDQGLIDEAKKLYEYRNLNALDTGIQKNYLIT